MIILDATTKSLQFKLAGTVATNQLPFSASYVDATATATTPGEQDGTSNNSTAVTLASAPASSTQRLIKSVMIQNADTAAAGVTVIYNNNATLRNIFMATLNSGDQLIYEDGDGWTCLDKNGNIKTSYTSFVAGQLPGTTTNDNASAGNVGEYISSTVLPGSAIALTNNVSANVTSIALSAGDWDVWATIAFSPGGSTVQTNNYAAISTTSATIPSSPGAGGLASQTNVLTGEGATFPVGMTRISVASSTTVYLVVGSTFSTSTQSAYGFIGARRRR